MATHQSNTTPIVSMGDGNTANVAAQAASSKSAESSRQLSDNELSYYLPGRADGVNDMYVHHGVRATPASLARPRVEIAWALQLVRHPLLAARVDARPDAYADVWFMHKPPSSLSAALAFAHQRLQYLDPRDGAGACDIVSTYLNGKRTLGDDMLACLIVRRGTRRDQHSPQAEDAEMDDFEVMLCTTHFVGDGMALHTFMNELYGLLGGSHSDDELRAMLEHAVADPPPLPPALEDRLGLSRFQTAVGDVAQRIADARLLGGQVLPGVRGRDRETVVPTTAFSPEDTQTALARCKVHGVTVANVVFALCAVAWTRRNGVDTTQPTMMYSALNMRPHMKPPKPPASPEPSFFHLAVGYFNVVLPSYTLSPSLTATDVVWLRAAKTRKQTGAVAKSPLAPALFRATASTRAARARHWARVDDAAAGKHVKDNLQEVMAPAPAGKALMGVSMLGNLDGMYKHATFPAVKMYSLTTGSRQRPGGLLLFTYTLAGKLWLSLGYDRNGFEQGVIESFWEDVLDLADKVLLGKD